MIKVIGKIGCGACVILKNKLEDQNIGFEYISFEDMDATTKREYVAKSKDAGIARFPMVFKDEEVVVDTDSLFE